MSLDALNGGNSGLNMDLRSLERLKATVGKDPKAGIRETAKQLESLFMQQLVKTMRATTMNTGMLDNSATEMGTNMLDTQLATKLTGLPGGLSEVITRQLERQLGDGKDAAASAGSIPLKGLPPMHFGRIDSATNADGSPAASSPITSQTADAVPTTLNGRKLSNAEQFIVQHQADAQAAEAATGISASHILGQAALESGWGKHEIRAKDGTPSHNLFGIKATADWKGKVAEVTTTEYIGGVARKVTAKFRAYDSYADAFKDHARLLSQNPRYSQTVAKADTAADYARSLQKGGYATDPAYASKLTQVINTALRLQRSIS
jgi:flagellar protein FlgJ